MTHAPEYVWCYYCEKASHTNDAHSTWGAFCPMCGSGNSLPGDYVVWEQFREFHPEYPAVSITDVHYPLNSKFLRRELEDAQERQRS